MSFAFEEIDFRPTRLGDLMLRRRKIPELGDDWVYEVKLGDEFLMSSLFTAAEVALADLALKELGGVELDVLVGGLGLGYTAATVLNHESVRSLLVVDGLAEVIDWHEKGLVPLGERLSSDPRCQFRHADFFKIYDAPDAQKLHAMLVDIDHAPDQLLDPSHAAFYRPEGLSAVRKRLHDGGVFALWSNDPPDETFLSLLSHIFERAESRVIPIWNPLREMEETNTVYLAWA